MRRFLGLVLVALAPTSALPASDGFALVATVHCGDTITQDTTLESDLVGCPGDALTVRGHDITLSLNGHIVQGGIRMTSEDLEGNSLGHGNLVVGNGTVLGTVAVGHTQDALVKHLTIRGRNQSGGGLSFFKGSSGAVNDALIEDSSVGFDTAHAGEIDISNTTIRHNYLGLGAGQGGFPKLTNSEISNNTYGGIYFSQAGVSLEHTLIARNGGYGISGDGGITATDSRIERNRAGGVEAAYFTLTRNRISHNEGDGVGAYWDGGSGTLVGNSIDHNGGDGVETGSPYVSVTANRIYDNALRGINAVRAGGHALTDNSVFGNGGDGIYVVDNRALVVEGNSASRNGGDGIRVAHAGGEDINFSWSPDGKRVVFQDSRGLSWDIYEANSDGTGVTQLTSDPGQDIKPQWSPDGTKIAFVSDRDGSPGLYVMRPDAIGLLKLAAIDTDIGGGEPIRPIEPSFAWSLDSKRIVFGGFSLSSVNADGTGLVTLSDAHLVRNPRWTPDGTRIVFEAGPWFPTLENTTYIMNADGTGLRKAVPATDFPNGTVGGPDRSERTASVDVRINPFATLTDNLADHNKQLGIEAVPGVADGGGNSANHNRDPRQCVGLECRP